VESAQLNLDYTKVVSPLDGNCRAGAGADWGPGWHGSNTVLTTVSQISDPVLFPD